MKSFSLQELFTAIEDEKFQRYDLINNSIEGMLLLNQEVTSHTFICKHGELVLPKESKLVLNIKAVRKIMCEQRLIEGVDLKYCETDEYLVEVNFEKRRRLTEEDQENYFSEGTGEEYLVLKFKKMNANRIVKGLEYEVTENCYVRYATKVHTFLEDKENGLDLSEHWRGYGSVPLRLHNELTFMDRALAETFQMMNPFVNEMTKEKDRLPIYWTEIIEARNKQDLLNKKYKRVTFSKSVNKYPLRYSYAFYKLRTKVTTDQLNKMKAFVEQHKSIDVFPSKIFDSKKNDLDFYKQLLESYLVKTNQVAGFKAYEELTYEQSELSMLLDDIYDMAQMLHKKITLNFTTVKGMRRYHDSLVELLNKQKQRKLKDFTFSFPQKFDQLIEAAEQDSRFEVIKTHKELFLEGLEMHHCVYSYLNLVMKGKCMILKYKDAEHRYTFEVRKRKNRKYSVRQCYGKYDSLPEPEIEHSIRAFTESVPWREMERA